MPGPTTGYMVCSVSFFGPHRLGASFFKGPKLVSVFFLAFQSFKGPPNRLRCSFWFSRACFLVPTPTSYLFRSVVCWSWYPFVGKPKGKPKPFWGGSPEKLAGSQQGMRNGMTPTRNHPTSGFPIKESPFGSFPKPGLGHSLLVAPG